ncbi:uncharacterized protein LOC144173110 [Haemaphysalis longicornis]
MSLAKTMGRVHLCFLVFFVEVSTSGHGAEPVDNASDAKKCDYKNIVACLEKQVRWIPKRFSERPFNTTNVTTSEENFFNEICRRNASECWRHSKSDGCRTEQQYTLDRFKKANAAALEELCKNRMEALKELYYDFLSWDVGSFKECFASMNISAVAEDIFSVQRSEQSCRTLLHQAEECTRNSYKKPTHATNSTKAAVQILIRFLNQMRCQELRSPVLNASDTLRSTAAAMTINTGGALLVPATEIRGDSNTSQGEGTSPISAANVLSRSPVTPSKEQWKLLTATTPQHVPIQSKENAITNDGLNNRMAREATRQTDQELRTATPQYVRAENTQKAVTDDGVDDQAAREASRKSSLANGVTSLHLTTPTLLNKRIQEGSFDSKHTSPQVFTEIASQLKHQPRTLTSKNGPAVHVRPTTPVLILAAMTAAANLIL